MIPATVSSVLRIKDASSVTARLSASVTGAIPRAPVVLVVKAAKAVEQAAKAAKQAAQPVKVAKQAAQPVKAAKQVVRPVSVVAQQVKAAMAAMTTSLSMPQEQMMATKQPVVPVTSMMTGLHPSGGLVSSVC